jgi:hypothetical protein
MNAGDLDALWGAGTSSTLSADTDPFGPADWGQQGWVPKVKCEDGHQWQVKQQWMKSDPLLKGTIPNVPSKMKVIPILGGPVLDHEGNPITG